MFPTISVKNVKLADCRRVVLIDFNKEDGTVQIRHYGVQTRASQLSRTVQQIVRSKVGFKTALNPLAAFFFNTLFCDMFQIPNLGKLTDISEALAPGANCGYPTSDSEVEDEASIVEMPYVNRTLSTIIVMRPL